MSKIKPGYFGVLLVLGILALALAGCGAPAAVPEAGPEAAAPSGESDKIFRINVAARIPAPDIWNPYIPGTYILQGMNQNMIEPTLSQEASHV